MRTTFKKTPQTATPRQKVVLDFIIDYQNKNSYSPSRREIAAALGLNSVATIEQHITALIEKELLKRTSDGTRNLEIVHSTKSVPAQNLPLLGRVAAGRPIEAIESYESIDVPQFMISSSGQYFVLKVSGNSMIEDGIFDKDYVVIKKQHHASNGDTVVALIEHEATIKRYYKKADQIHLLPANSDYKPIIVKKNQNFHIAGILSGVLRSYK